MNKTLHDFLRAHAGGSPVSFHMPGHKGAAVFRRLGYDDFLDNMVDWDITEIPGADNLFQTEGVIANIMERYRGLYESRASYLLINGSSCGLIASIMSSVPRGGRLIMARNCHKSVFNGLSLAGAEPVYAYPEMIESYGITGEISVDEIRRCLDAAPDASAVLLPSPNYYGICSDIGAIGELVHSRGKILIVDQAHGAHLKFFDEYGDGQSMAAENLGADIVIDSVHKTLASFTQSAVANVFGDRVNLFDFEDALQKIESTSPSYLLMTSLDVNADIMEKHGQDLIADWRSDLDWFYEAATEIDGLHVMNHSLLDDSKLNLDMSLYGLDGLALEKKLMARNIYPELVTGNIVMCMTGIGNRRCDYEALIGALSAIASEHDLLDSVEASPAPWSFKDLKQHSVPAVRIKSQLNDAAGKVCAASIIPYPPGIPIICPGEELDQEIIDYVSDLRARGENVMGVDSDGCIMVGA
ncbi:aminotransferase class I/II-fold pyridoxal phosphate-dependent enzyme [Aminicella lysinilytica]|uniref:aminotransferase class I/II-fold pyridoxal phosphate-dependent enzyme n=1 Tax=Aminicella lysinilytica TaxID=433323 RepID=UPI0026F294E3|nr:hypothetical protein [Aminicella lysinilytica]